MLGGVPYRAAVLLYVLLIKLLYRVSIVTGSLPLNTLNIQADIDFAQATEACIFFPDTDYNSKVSCGVGGVDCDPISSVIVAVLVAKAIKGSSLMASFLQFRLSSSNLFSWSCMLFLVDHSITALRSSCSFA